MLKEEIVAKGKEIGFVDIKFTDSEPFIDFREHLQKLKNKGEYPPFVTDDINLRTDPKKILSNCNTIIAVALSYKHLMDLAIQSPLPPDYGYISPSAWDIDYHILLKKSMDELIEFINKKTNFKYIFEAFVDTGHLSDREVAKRAGLGYVGKNSSLINQESGSYIWLGHILTDLEIEPDKEIEGECGSCRKCIVSCPTKAIGDDGTIAYSKCLANVLVQKGDLSEETINKMDYRVYGCDTCQIVCPKNKGIKNMQLDEPVKSLKPGWIPFQELDCHSNRTFKEKYGHTAFSWRGKGVLKRNADAIRKRDSK